MDDSVGTVRPEDPSRYTMRLNGDGTVSMRLDCNRATGTWSAEAGPDGTSGRFDVRSPRSTRALCPPPSLDERVAAQAPFVRSYLLKDGRLYLSLMADGGIFVWEPYPEAPFRTKPDTDLEAAIRRAESSYTRAVVDVEGGTGRGRYVYGRVDLNSDGRDEVFVYFPAPSSAAAAAATCCSSPPTPGTSTWRSTSSPSAACPSSSRQRRPTAGNDVVRLESGGGAKASFRHAFDGTRYVERERLRADKAPEGKSYLAGEVTFEKGIPLEPGEGR